MMALGWTWVGVGLGFTHPFAVAMPVALAAALIAVALRARLAWAACAVLTLLAIPHLGQVFDPTYGWNALIRFYTITAVATPALAAFLCWRAPRRRARHAPF